MIRGVDLSLAIQFREVLYLMFSNFDIVYFYVIEFQIKNKALKLRN